MQTTKVIHSNSAESVGATAQPSRLLLLADERRPDPVPPLAERSAR
jgi:hypothetical protein